MNITTHETVDGSRSVFTSMPATVAAKPGYTVVPTKIHFDFRSPDAYLAHRVVPAIRALTRASFLYVPVLLADILTAAGDRSRVETLPCLRNKPDYERPETQCSVTRGAFGCPIFFLRNALWFGKIRLCDLDDAILGLI